MRRIYIYIIIFQFFYFLIACDRSGNIFLTSGYEYNIVVRSFYDYNATIVEQLDDFHPGMTFAVAARSNRYDYITAIQIEDMDKTVLASYTQEYLANLRKSYIKKKNQQEVWVFTEKGLFLETNEISKRYKWDAEKIIAYYRSDEAVQDLQAMLEAGE
jgi:hypothetical protein